MRTWVFCSFLLSSLLFAQENKTAAAFFKAENQQEKTKSEKSQIDFSAKIPSQKISQEDRRARELKFLPRPKKENLPKLKTLIFISSDTVLLPPAAVSSGIKIRDLKIPEEKKFILQMEKFLNRQIDSEFLLELKKTVVDYYWKGDFPLVRVLVPADQDVTEGVIQVVILPSKLGQIRIEGSRYSSDEKLKKEISLQEGGEIKPSLLVDDAAWLEGDPFRTVDIIYEPGERLGTTDIVLYVKEQFPFKAYAGYENNPYKSAGSSRYKAGFNWGHLFWLDHQINFEFATAEKTRSWFSAAGSYLIPLPWRHRLKLFYNYNRSRATSKELNIISGSVTKGQLWQIGGRYDLPLKDFGFYSHLLQFGYDFKRSNDFLEYYGYNVTTTQADISQFLVRYEGREIDKWGRTFFGLSVYLSSGGMSAFNRNHYFHTQRRGAQSDYIYGTFNLDRYQLLGGNWSWIVSTVMQMSTGKLLATEEFALGGHLTVRGYLENEVLGDRGLLLKNEIRTPALHFIKPWNDAFQVLAFIDFGFLNEVDQNVLSRDTSVLLSAGPGFIYKINWNVDVRFDAGFQMKSVHGKLFGKDIKNRIHLGAFLTF